MPGGVVMGGQEHGSCGQDTEGVGSPRTDNWVAAGNSEFEGPALACTRGQEFHDRPDFLSSSE